MADFVQLPASAFVECERKPVGPMLGMYRVEVVGREPHDYARVYNIHAKTEHIAVNDAFQRFHEEISELINKKD